MRKASCFFAVLTILILGLPAAIYAQAKDPAATSPKAAGNARSNNSDSEGQLRGSGLMGYISSKAAQPTTGYGAGIGFYVAVYPILPEPIDNFQK